MKNIFILYFMMFSIACADSKDFEDIKEDDKIEEPVAPEEEVPGIIVNPGDVSDMSRYDSKPYYADGAGYQGDEMANLPADRIVDFVHKQGESDTEELEKLIDELSSKGGGKITIKSGEYEFRDVLLKSNIHIYIESNTTITLENKELGKNQVNGYRVFFTLSGTEVGKPLENVKIVGLGTLATRPKMIIEPFIEWEKPAMNRAISVTYVKNALIENFTIQDNFTKGSAIAFNPVDINGDEETAQIPENVTVTNVSLTKGSIGYGLAQTNVGRNILLRNLSCEGGMTCRIEAHTGRKYDLGVYNIVVKNVGSKNGKAAVLLQPHSVVNGRVLVDIAKSEGSSWTLFLKEGFVGADSKRKEKGTFPADSKFTNISLASEDERATLSYKNYQYVPDDLKPLYGAPNFVFNEEDVNHSVNNGTPSNECPVIGPSVAVVLTNTTYPLILPNEEDLLLTGKTEGRVKVVTH